MLEVELCTLLGYYMGLGWFCVCAGLLVVYYIYTLYTFH